MSELLRAHWRFALGTFSLAIPKYLPLSVIQNGVNFLGRAKLFMATHPNQYCIQNGQDQILQQFTSPLKLAGFKVGPIVNQLCYAKEGGSWHTAMFEPSPLKQPQSGTNHSECNAAWGMEAQNNLACTSKYSLVFNTSNGGFLKNCAWVNFCMFVTLLILYRSWWDF